MSKIISSLKEIFSTGGMVILGLGPYLYIFLVIPGFVFLKGMQTKFTEKNI
jgi:hypothetical protein